MNWKEQIIGMSPYKPGKTIDDVKAQYGLSEVTKLASNENPYGCSEQVLHYLKEIAPNFAYYPDGYASNLRQTLAHFLDVNETQLLFGNGSDELIMIISRALLNSEVNTVMATPTFPQYRHNAQIEGAEVREIPLVEGAHDFQAMLSEVDDQTAVVWVCSPNNPTGVLADSDELEKFIKQISKDVLIVVDEAYFEYITNNEYTDSIQLIEKYPNVIVLRTFSKAYGLAAFRVGYAIGNEEVIQQLDPVREPFNNTTLSQHVAKLAIEDQEFIRQTVDQTLQGKKQYEEFAKVHHLHMFPSEANFVLLEVKQDADNVFQKLLEKGFIVRSGNALGTPNYIRITIGSKDQNEQLLKELAHIL